MTFCHIEYYNFDMSKKALEPGTVHLALIAALACAIGMTGCGESSSASTAPARGEGPLRVLATTGMIGDTAGFAVSQVAVSQVAALPPGSASRSA